MGRDQHERDCLDAAEGLAKALGGSDGWIDHDGGECPLGRFRGHIEIRLANGRVLPGRARGFYWKHLATPHDLVAYRLRGPLPAGLVKGD